MPTFWRAPDRQIGTQIPSLAFSCCRLYNLIIKLHCQWVSMARVRRIIMQTFCLRWTTLASHRRWWSVPWLVRWVEPYGVESRLALPRHTLLNPPVQVARPETTHFTTRRSSSVQHWKNIWHLFGCNRGVAYFHTPFTPVLHYWNTRVTPRLPPYTTLTPLIHPLDTSNTWSDTQITLPLHQWNTHVTPLKHPCYTTETP